MIKATSKRTNKCPIKQITDCIYQKPEDCNYNKKTCLIPSSDISEEEEENKLDIKNLVCLIIISIFLLAISILVPVYMPVNKCKGWMIFLDIMSAIGISLFTGVVLAFLINIPQYMQDYTKLITTSLSSSKYLMSLSRQQLTNLRNRITHQLHIKNVPLMPMELIDLDERLCKLLEEPYYSKYREIIHCSKADKYDELRLNKQVKESNGNNKKYIKKQVIQEYTLCNPYDEYHAIKADIGLSNHMNLDNDCDLDGIFSINSFNICIDDSRVIDIKHMLKIGGYRHAKAIDIDPQFETYNTGIYLT